MAENVNIKINVDANEGVKQTTNFKAKMKELKEQMVELEVTTNGLSEATAEQRQKYAELQAQAGQISDAMGDVAQRIRATADDYQTFNAVMEGGKGLIAMAQGVEGVTSMLGINNQTVERSIQVMGSLQSIMNSVNTVQQLFNKDSKVRIAITKLLATETKKSAVAEVEATAATGALAAGEGVATGASFTLVGALKAVSVAIKSIPVIGWILAAVAAVGSLIALVVSANDESEEGIALQEAASENLAKQQAQYEAVDSKIIEIRDNLSTWNDILLTSDKNSTIYKETLKQLGDELGIDLENQKVDTKTLNKLEEIHIRLKEAQLQQEFDQNQYLADRNKLQQINNVLNAAAALDHKERAQFIQDELGISEKAAADYAAAIHNGMDAHKTWQDALADGNTATAASYDRLKQSVDGYSDKAKENAANVKAIMDEEDKAIKDAGLQRQNVSKNTSKASQQAAKDAEKAAEEAAEKIKKRAEEVAKGIKDASEKISAYRKTSEDAIKAENEKTHEGRLWNIQAEYGETIATLDKEKSDYEKFYEQLSDEEKKNAKTVEQFAKEQVNLREQALKKYNDAVEEENKNEERIRIDFQNKIDSELLELKLGNLKEGTAEYYNLEKELDKEREEQELEDIERRFEDGELNEETYQTMIDEIHKKHSDIRKQIDDEEKQNNINNTLEKLDSVYHYAEIAGQLLSTLSNFTQSLQDAELANAEGNEKKQKEIKKKYAVANMVMTIGQIAVETLMGATAALANGIRDMGMPIGAIVGGVMAALVTATGIANTVKAVREKNNIMKAARGAFIVGPSHSQGGVTMEVEGGEAVLNKRAMAIPQYRAIASAMNVSTGGVAFPGTNANQSLMTSTIDRSDLKAIVSETVAAVASIPVVVSESTITNTQRKVSAIEGRSRI